MKVDHISVLHVLNAIGGVIVEFLTGKRITINITVPKNIKKNYIMRQNGKN